MFPNYLTSASSKPDFHILTSTLSYKMSNKPLSDDEANDRLQEGDKDIIDKKLEELNVSKTSSGKDQTDKPDTEGSDSSSKNLDEQDD